jgi:hypothetical protein
VNVTPPSALYTGLIGVNGFTVIVEFVGIGTLAVSK